MLFRLVTAAAATALASLALVAPASARSSDADVAALQVAMKALGRYHGAIDGIQGPATRGAVKAFQRAHHLAADGVAGPATRRALGRRGRPMLGTRVMSLGDRGWDVAALQFMLRRRGYSPGTVDGGFGPGTAGAVRRFQVAARIAVDGRAGQGTLSALRQNASRQVSSSTPSGPIRLLRPVPGPIGDGFGYPGGRRHDGVDFPEPYGTPIGAAGVGTVVFAGWNSGGYGNLTVIQHRLGYQTWYGHQSAIYVHQGQAVAGGTMIGRIGSTGHSTGPHLHFELRHNGVPINPVPFLLPQTSLGKALFSKQPPRCLDGASGRGGAMPPVRQSPRNAVLVSC